MEPLTITAILGWMLIGVALAVWRLPVAQCAECPHCRLEQLRQQADRAVKAREQEATVERSFGVGRCDRCGRVDLHDHDHDR